MSREDDVRDLENALRACIASADDSLGVVVVEESVASPRDDRPGFTNNLGTCWNSDGVANEVGTSIKEDDLAARIL